MDSTFAYQGKARKLGYQTILELHRHHPLNLLPHRTYFLDIGLEDSMQRQKARGKEKDYFESEQGKFYLDLIDGYKDAAQEFPDRILTIPAAQDQQKVSSLILKDLEKIII
jgi:dTMP kinase